MACGISAARVNAHLSWLIFSACAARDLWAGGRKAWIGASSFRGSVEGTYRKVVVPEVDAHPPLGADAESMIAWGAVVGEENGAHGLAVDLDHDRRRRLPG